jgi:ribosomal protein L37AE/L43A
MKGHEFHLRSHTNWVWKCHKCDMLWAFGANILVDWRQYTPNNPSEGDLEMPTCAQEACEEL